LDPEVVWVIDPPAVPRLVEDLGDEIDELLDGGDSVVALGRFRVRGAQSGATGTQPIAVVVKVRDGKLVAYRAYFDREQALEAVGLRE
jgi:ketosteroid isomerase-like protein